MENSHPKHQRKVPKTVIFRITFVVVLFSVLMIACGDRYRGICQTETTLITKNKALAATGSTIYGDPYVEARTC